MSALPFDRGFLWLLLACAGTLLALPAAMRLAPVIGAIDDPTVDDRRIHRTRIPRIGGLAVATVFLLAFMLQGHLTHRGMGFLSGLGLLVAVGVLDDTRGLSPKVKLLGQCLAMFLAVWGSGLYVAYVPVPLLDVAPITDPAVRMLVTWFVGVGIINAMNLIDGLDGLAAGIGSVAGAGLAVLAALEGNTDLCLSATLLVGCLLAVLAFNSHPARIFLGDTGSMLIGYLLACFGAALVVQPGPMAKLTYSPLLPLLFVVVPCADCVWVMISRIIRGKHPFRGDKTHVHHHVLGLGLRHQYAVLALLAISMGIAAFAILLRHKGDDVVFLALICLVQTVILGVRSLARARSYRRLVLRAVRFQRDYHRIVTPAEGTVLPRGRLLLQEVNAWALRASFVALCALYGLAGLRPTELLGWTAAALLVLLAAVMVATRSGRHHFVFFVAFAAVSFLSLCSDMHLRTTGDLHVIAVGRALLLICFSAAVLELFLSRRFHQLVSTPIEVLVLGMGLTIILFARGEKDFNLPAVAASSVALFVVIKASACDYVRFRWPLFGVAFGLATFVGVQAACCGMTNPLPRLLPHGGAPTTIAVAGFMADTAK
jgi:UDP-GlcNAc:undecaprenyl-phosphate GlcNAc-1-phosphate transferase